MPGLVTHGGERAGLPLGMRVDCLVQKVTLLNSVTLRVINMYVGNDALCFTQVNAR